MISSYEVIETNEMIDKENLDVRTITLGISLIDCIDSDLETVKNNIYNKIKKLGVEQIFYVTLGYSDYSGGTYTDAKRIQFNDEIKKIVAEMLC